MYWALYTWLHEKFYIYKAKNYQLKSKKIKLLLFLITILFFWSIHVGVNFIIITMYLCCEYIFTYMHVSIIIGFRNLTVVIIQRVSFIESQGGCTVSALIFAAVTVWCAIEIGEKINKFIIYIRNICCLMYILILNLQYYAWV